jgi:hypothetical protein
MRSVKGIAVVGVVITGCGSQAVSTVKLRQVAAHPRGRAVLARPPLHLSARRLRPRRGLGAGAVPPGTRVPSSDLFSNRVFANARDGFALANDGQAQYPVTSTDGGQTWRIDGPQVHIDAADGAEGVGWVGILGPRTFSLTAVPRPM